MPRISLVKVHEIPIWVKIPIWVCYLPGFIGWIPICGIPTPLKNDGLRQIGSSSQLVGNIKNVPNHQPVINGYIMATNGF